MTTRQEINLSDNRLNSYNTIILTQPLAYNKHLKQIYNKCEQGWCLIYESNSAYHVCPFDGAFKDCKDCGALEEDFDTEYCLKKKQFFDTAALRKRIIDCIKADLPVEMFNIESSDDWLYRLP